MAIERLVIPGATKFVGGYESLAERVPKTTRYLTASVALNT